MTIIDHLKNIRNSSGNKQWEDLTQKEQSTFNVYLIYMFLMQNPKLIEVLDILQLHSFSIKPKYIYNMLCKIIPLIDDGRFYKFKKKIKDYITLDMLVNDISTYTECDYNEGFNYIFRVIDKINNKDIGQQEGIDFLLEFSFRNGRDVKEVKLIEEILWKKIK